MINLATDPAADPVPTPFSEPCASRAAMPEAEIISRAGRGIRVTCFRFRALLLRIRPLGISISCGRKAWVACTVLALPARGVVNGIQEASDSWRIGQQVDRKTVGQAPSGCKAGWSWLHPWAPNLQARSPIGFRAHVEGHGRRHRAVGSVWCMCNVELMSLHCIRLVNALYCDASKSVQWLSYGLCLA